MVTWDSDGSLDSDDSSDDDKKSIKKALASITINNKPSIFDTPSTCLMAKPTKVNYKARGRHWVHDSGCTQHMTVTQECSIQSTQVIAMELIVSTFGDNGKGKVKGLGKIAISNDLSISNVLLVESLTSTYCR